MSALIPHGDARSAPAAAREVVVIRSGSVAVERPARRVYPDEVLFAPLTRVEFAALEARGGNPRDWVRDLPREQRERPQGVVVADASGASQRRFRLSSTVTVVEQ